MNAKTSAQALEAHRLKRPRDRDGVAFRAGRGDGMAPTAHDYVVVVLTAGKLMQETANGEIVTELAAGQAYARNVGVEHNVVNPNPHEFVPLKGVLKRMFIEVELK